MDQEIIIEIISKLETLETNTRKSIYIKAPNYIFISWLNISLFWCCETKMLNGDFLKFILSFMNKLSSVLSGTKQIDVFYFLPVKFCRPDVDATGSAVLGPLDTNRLEG